MKKNRREEKERMDKGKEKIKEKQGRERVEEEWKVDGRSIKLRRRSFLAP